MNPILPPQTETELERVFGAEGLAVWNTIRTHFEFSQGFAWIFVAVPDTFSAEVLKRDLYNKLEVTQAPTQTPAELEQLPQWLLTPHPTQAIWVSLTKLEGSTGATAWAAALTTAVERINEQRDGIRKQQTCPIVFAIAPWVKTRIRVHAPDLWSNRTVSTEILPAQTRENLEMSNPATAFITQPTPVTSFLDPNLALAEAEKIKDIPQQEENHKKLLRRAINGFIGQSEQYAQDGKWESAFEAAENAVATAKMQPKSFESELGSSLNNLGVRYNALGQRENAFTATLEAKNLYEKLARERPDAFNPNLAGSLNNLGAMYDALGQRENALTVTLEAKNLYEKLARERPDAFNPDLAGSLNNLGNGYDALGQRENAFTATLEAVKIRRELARERPDAFNPDLAGSLNNLGNRYDALGQRENALTATLEAVEIYTDLYKRNRIAFAERYAMALNSLSDCYRALDQLEQAYDNAYLAVQVLSEVFLQYPQALERRMKYMVNDYRSLCEALNREPDHQLLAQIMPVLEPLLST
jgi:tetratricopeptide (TPR) repeat protein